MWRLVTIFYLALVLNALVPVVGYHTSPVGITPADSVSPLAPLPYHGRLSIEIANVLRFQHYREPELNDSFSAQVFDRYLRYLDPGRMYFLKRDIDQFSKARYSIDDMLRTGDVQWAYDVYETYRKRVNQRIDFTLSLKEQSFDYTTRERYRYDRENAPWLHTAYQLDSLWTLKIKSEALSLRLAGKGEDESETTIARRYENLRNNLRKQKSEDVYQLFMNAVCETADPHTNYFAPPTADNFKISMSNSLEGIGATLRTEGEFTKIIALTKGGPAEKSKELSVNDKIIAVAQGDTGRFEDVIGMRIDEVVSRIRGPKGTVVRLQILGANDPVGSPPRTVRLVRDKIKLEDQSAKSEILRLKSGNTTYKFGVVHLPSFYLDQEAMQKGEKDFKSTTRDVRMILEQFEKEKVQGVIIDLRGNGGGSLYEAVELTGLFVDREPIVQVRNNHGHLEVRYDEVGVAWRGPLLVMVDRFSASASEIFSAAIQDMGRGVVVGSKTFGKGTVQNIVDLNRLMPREKERLGQVKLTVAKFYRISGGSTQHAGVTPDVPFASAIPEDEYGESAEPTALPFDQIAPVTHRGAPLEDLLLQTLRYKSALRLEKSQEYQWYLEDIEMNRRKRLDGTVTLNEEEMKEERRREEERQLMKLNAMRQKKGLKPLEKLSDRPKDEKDEDFLLTEAGYILADYIKEMQERSDNRAQRIGR